MQDDCEWPEHSWCVLTYVRLVCLREHLAGVGVTTHNSVTSLVGGCRASPVTHHCIPQRFSDGAHVVVWDT